MSTPEGDIQTKICLYLEKKGYMFFRTNNTPVFDRKLNNGHGAYRSQGRFAAPGLSDIILIDKKKNGKAIFLEVKTPKGRQSTDQNLFEKRAYNNNAEYYLVKSLEDIKTLGY